MASEEKTRTKQAEPQAPRVETTAAPTGKNALTVAKASPPATRSAGSVAIREPLARARDRLATMAGGSSGLAWSFVLIVVLPAIFAGLYLAFIAKSQYVSEARFVVRGAVEPMRVGSTVPGVPFSVDNQESHVVAAYVRSRAMVEAITKTIDLRAMYPGLLRDPVFGLAEDSTIDQLVAFWNKQVTVVVEPISSVIRVTVRAFTPEDALTLSQAVLRESERIVNEISVSGRTDRLQQATAELRNAEAELRGLRAEVERFRDQQGTIDPTQSAKDRFEGLTKLRDERATLNTELLAVSNRLSADSPVIRVLKERLRSMDDKIAALEAALLDTPNRPGAVNQASLAAAADLEARRKLATERLERAELDVQNARLELTRQSVYVLVFMQPTLAQEYSYPMPFAHTAIVAAVLLMGWSICALYVRGIRARTR